MKKYVVLLIFTCLLMFLVPSLIYGAELQKKGEVVKEDSIVVSVDKAYELLLDLEIAKYNNSERLLLNKQISNQDALISNVKKQRDAYKQSYEETQLLLEEQMKLTDDTAKQCQELIDASKPTLLEDAGKVGAGVLVGVLVLMFL